MRLVGGERLAALLLRLAYTIPYYTTLHCNAVQCTNLMLLKLTLEAAKLISHTSLATCVKVNSRLLR